MSNARTPTASESPRAATPGGARVCGANNQTLPLVLSIVPTGQNRLADTVTSSPDRKGVAQTEAVRDAGDGSDAVSLVGS